MSKKPFPIVEVTLDSIIGGGQTIGTLESGKKCLVWGGLPGERVHVQVTKKKSSFVEGFVTEVIEPSEQRVTPRDETSFLSTSPWQMMDFASEEHYKSALIEEAFELHNIVLPEKITTWSDGVEYGYRNKIEYSFWWDKEADQLDLAFFRRGSRGKIPVQHTSLALPAINTVAHAIRDTLREHPIQAFMLKTVIIRCDQQGNVAAQLYVKDEHFEAFTEQELRDLGVTGFELIYSNPNSPASVITKRLQAWGETTLTDSILDVPFTYAVEGFFQINIPVYEQALRDMKAWVNADKPVVDLYSGVGSIGLTIGGDNVTMVEINEHAVREMERNITAMEREKTAKAILAPSEAALDHITSDSTIILDPPRAGLHQDVVDKLLEAAPERIIYLSCNPVTQARDVALLGEKYGVRHHQGYNFFPRTPHIEHLVVLDLKK